MCETVGPKHIVTDRCCHLLFVLQVLLSNYVTDPVDRHNLSSMLDYWLSYNAIRKDFEIPRCKTVPFLPLHEVTIFRHITTRFFCSEDQASGCAVGAESAIGPHCAGGGVAAFSRARRARSLQYLPISRGTNAFAAKLSCFPERTTNCRLNQCFCGRRCWERTSTY